MCKLYLQAPKQTPRVSELKIRNRTASIYYNGEEGSDEEICRSTINGKHGEVESSYITRNESPSG